VDLIELIERHGLSAHLYADDNQVYGSCRPTDVVSFSTMLTRCVDETASHRAVEPRQSRSSLVHDKSTSALLLSW